MLRGGLVFGALALGSIALFPACGDRAGNPVVRAEPSLSGESGAGGQSDGGLDLTAPSGGLCTPCESGRDCGDHDDYCLESSNDERFCARDCSEGDGCPVGYECQFVDNADEAQCVPTSGNCSHIEQKPQPDLPLLREKALEYVNALRFDFALPPLEHDECLTELAQQSTYELAETGDYLGMWERECQGMNECECGWSAEAEGVVAAFGLLHEDVIERTIQENLSESPMGNFSRVLFSDEFTRVGVRKCAKSQRG